MSRELPTLKPAKVLWALQRTGFFIHHTKGSHYYLIRIKPGVRVTVPCHSGDLKRRTLVSIVE
jgi:predicted RNA binding protein YcfA (HicA-like mRNA interferase family)